MGRYTVSDVVDLIDGQRVLVLREKSIPTSELIYEVLNEDFKVFEVYEGKVETIVRAAGLDD